ncbi:MAG: inositol monophosphatase family protein [Actinomycetota bacterium]
MTPETVLECFVDAAAAVRTAVAAVPDVARRDRTARPGQYALDLVADAAACAVLGRLPVRVLSEESGIHERAAATVTVVLDPVDGSTNCARGLAYWATSICAVDADGPWCALVVNQATGAAVTAVRGGGARRDERPLRASAVTAMGDAVVGLGGLPPRHLGWKQSRVLGCCALELCEVAAGGLDGYLSPGAFHAPWDYLGGLLACTEAGAIVRDSGGEVLVTDDPGARRRLVAAGTPELLAALSGAEPS